MSRSKRLLGVANAAPPFWGHNFSGRLPKPHLIQVLVHSRLLANIFPDNFFISTHCGHEEPSCPNVLARNIPLPLPIGPDQMDGTRAFGSSLKVVSI